MRYTKLIKSSLFILNLYFFGFGISVEEESKNDEFQSNITGMESIQHVGDIFGLLLTNRSNLLPIDVALIVDDFIKSTKMEQSC